MSAKNRMPFLELLKTQGGYSLFCNRCERKNMCEDKVNNPKVLEVVSTVIKYRNHESKPFPGDKLRQPIFFNEMSDKIDNVVKEMQAEDKSRIANKGSKK